MKKLFYNAVLNHDVTDLSGKKTKAKIVKEFGGKLVDWEEIFFDETTHQVVRIADGSFDKKTHAQIQGEKDAKAQAEQTKNENNAQPILAKLGITKDELKKLLKL